MSEQTQENPMKAEDKLEQAIGILQALGLPKAQLNERSGLSFLALLDLQPDGSWQELDRPRLGVTPIMDWCKDTYGKEYAPNTRESFRRQTLHQFVDAAIVLLNPDKPERAVNSPKTCYQVTAELLELLLSYGTDQWAESLAAYLKIQKTLVEKYAMQRDMQLIPLEVAEGVEIKLSAGAHSQLIHDIVVEFGPRFAPGAEVKYVGDTGDKYGHFMADRLKELGISVDSHGKLPDVVLYYPEKDWLFLIESVTSHGPVDGKRMGELSELFKSAKPGLVYVTAFPDRKTMNKYFPEISWETEVWIADAPTHRSILTATDF